MWSNRYSMGWTSKDEYSNFYFSTSTLNEFDERIYFALSLEATKTDSNSRSNVQLEASVIPSYKKLIDLTNKKVIEINKNESNDFQKTCRYFNLWELQQYVNIHFMKGLFHNKNYRALVVMLVSIRCWQYPNIMKWNDFRSYMRLSLENVSNSLPSNCGRNES